VSRRDKLRRRLRQQPHNASMADLETLLLRFGYVLERISGSHRTYLYNDDRRSSIIVVPAHGQKVRATYVKLAIRELDRLFPETTEDEEEDAGHDDQNH
jgi:predicted RNA binding protein YcfA (HicA-like mRNA interferase family)